MDKWADYLITGVRYNSNEIFITYVEIRKDNGNDTGKAEMYTRESIVASIKKNVTFCTAITQIDDEGKKSFKKGSDVNIIVIDGIEYLRTDQNKTKRDNLENLPQI
jgi:hypothetical protein